MDEMTKPHPTLYTIEYVGDSDAFADRLTRANVTLRDRSSNGVMAIELPAANRQRLVFEAARDSKVLLRGLHPKRSTLEEMFMAAIRKQGEP